MGNAPSSCPPASPGEPPPAQPSAETNPTADTTPPPAILIFGCGNLLLSDEGFGVHFIRYLERHYRFPAQVHLMDGGTLGLFAAHALEEADRVWIIDAVSVEGAAGNVLRFTKPDIMLRQLPVKLSPHQIGVQEMLLVSELRGRCPAEIVLLGVVPGRIAPGSQLSPPLEALLPALAAQLLAELKQLGITTDRI
jgi:hydrogenase maturation protease